MATKTHLSQMMSLVIAANALISLTLPAQAVTFNFTYNDDVTQEQKKAFEFAGIYWSQNLADDVAINIHVDFANSAQLPTGVLGGALPAFMNNVSYSGLRNALNNDKTSTFDNTAVSNLAAGTSWNAVVRDPLSTNTSSISNSTLSLTTANAKALGLMSSSNSALDGVILLNKLDNTIYSWATSEVINTVGNQQFDMTSVAIHEIGHILGFVSSLDGVNANNYWDMNNRKKIFTPFDLFRYSSYSANSKVSDLSNGYDTYFSLDRGASSIGYLSTGTDKSSLNGDGFQGSHWKNYDTTIGVMTPALRMGTYRDIDVRDKTVFDVIGWQTKNVSLSHSDMLNQAITKAQSAVSLNRNADINNMLNQSRWGGTTTTTSLNQTQDLANYLAQQGFFQQGMLWDSIPTDITFVEQADVTSVPEPAVTFGLMSLLSFAGLRLKKFPRDRSKSI